MQDIKIKYRTWFKGVPPKPIKLQIPGWAGHNHNHSDGEKPQPWHCPPFVSGSTYGLELIYPFDSECHVHTKDGKVEFEGDFSKESQECKRDLPPFNSFAPGHYGFTSSLDLECDPDHVMRIEPHPRYYIDTVGDVPLCITGHLEPWWSRIFFVVFKAPWEGQTHIFRKGEPFAQLLIVPNKVRYVIEEMTKEEKEARTNREAKIVNCSKHIARNSWADYKGNRFDDKYKIMSNAYAKGGYEAVDDLLDKAIKKSRNIKADRDGKKLKIKHKFIKI